MRAPDEGSVISVSIGSARDERIAHLSVITGAVHGEAGCVAFGSVGTGLTSATGEAKTAGMRYSQLPFLEFVAGNEARHRLADTRSLGESVPIRVH